MSAFTPAQREMLDIIPFALAETSYFVTELKVRPFAVISGRKPMMEICISTNIRGGNCFTATRHQIFIGPNGGVHYFHRRFAFSDGFKYKGSRATKHILFLARQADAWRRSGYRED